MLAATLRHTQNSLQLYSGLGTWAKSEHHSPETAHGKPHLRAYQCASRGWEFSTLGLTFNHFGRTSRKRRVFISYSHPTPSFQPAS